MNNLEINAANAIISCLSIDSVLAIVPPRRWNDSDEATMPRIAIKARQGNEIACGLGMYSIQCEVVITCRILDDQSDDWMRRARSLINDRAAWASFNYPNGAEELLTTPDFVCKGVIPMPASGGNDTDKRIQMLSFEMVGFDLNRFEVQEL